MALNINNLNKNTMNKEEFIKEVKDLAVDFWTMNLHNGTFEEKLTELIDKREEVINYAHSSTQLKEKHKLSFEEWKDKWFEQENDVIYIDKLTREFLDINDIINKYQEYKLNL